MPVAGGMEKHMKFEQKILIAGGDMRQIFCAARLAEEYDISAAGFSSVPLPDSVRPADRAEKYDCIILPVPPLDENGNVNAPCLDEALSLEETAGMLKKGGLVMTGKNDPRLAPAFPESDIIDYMSREELCLKNAVPTAEGAVKIALEELPVALNGLPVLIVGLGRIGAALAEILKGFGADITAAVRSERGAAKARILGIRSVRTEQMGTKYALVFNTAPELIFSRDMLAGFDDDTLFIDLASRPGGIDFDAAAELGKKVIWALGIPGKNAPVTAGNIVAETAAEILAERRKSDE